MNPKSPPTVKTPPAMEGHAHTDHVRCWPPCSAPLGPQRFHLCSICEVCDGTAPDWRPSTGSCERHCPHPGHSSPRNFPWNIQDKWASFDREDIPFPRVYCYPHRPIFYTQRDEKNGIPLSLSYIRLRMASRCETANATSLAFPRSHSRSHPHPPLMSELTFPQCSSGPRPTPSGPTVVRQATWIIVPRTRSCPIVWLLSLHFF